MQLRCQYFEYYNKNDKTLINFRYNIAKGLKTENYGLVFGVNTFAALLLQAVLTFAVAGKHGFSLDIRTQVKLKKLFYVVICKRKTCIYFSIYSSSFMVHTTESLQFYFLSWVFPQLARFSVTVHQKLVTNKHLHLSYQSKNGKY